MNKNNECSSPAGTDDDHDYVEIDKLRTGPTYKQCAETDDDHDYAEIDKLGTGPTYKQCAETDDDCDYAEIDKLGTGPTSKQRAESDDDDDYVNTKDLDSQPTSKQSADDDESDDDNDDNAADYVNTGKLYKRPPTKQSSESDDDDFDDDDDDDDKFVNTKDLDNRPTSKRRADDDESDDDSNDYIQRPNKAQICLHPSPIINYLMKPELNLCSLALVEKRKFEKKDLQVHELLSENQNIYDHTEMKVIQRAPASSNGKLKRLLMILVLLLVTLAALFAVLILYLSDVTSIDTIKKEQKREAAVICEEGWRSLGLKCYFFSEDKLNWMESRDSCVKKGADLVIITSKKEQDFLSSLAKETSWIGLNDLEAEGKWMWVNKQILEETGVTFWYQRTEGKSEPDNWKMEDPNGENCASLGHSVYDLDQWFDVSCLLKKKYICQK